MDLNQKKLGETSMVFGKKISTDVVNFLFYLPGKAVRRGYPRGERDNVKGGNGVIALRPVKKRTTTDRRKGEKKKRNYRPNQSRTIYPGRTRPRKPQRRVPRVPSRTIFARIFVLTASKGTLLPLNSTRKRNRPSPRFLRYGSIVPQSFQD